MKRIPLSGKRGKGKFALVSDCDYKFLSQYKWHYSCGYAKRVGPRPKRLFISMSDVVAARKGIVGTVDHKNRDKLNNNRRNLRPATSSQNSGNVDMWSHNTSGFKGVGVCNRCGKWRAYVHINGKLKHLGYFPPTAAGRLAAALTYNRAAKKYFGKFACINKIKGRRSLIERAMILAA